MVEMVVVLGVVAVLFPLLTNSTERGRRTACMSNLRNMGTALGLYSSENDGWLPQHVGGFQGVAAPDTSAWHGHTLWREGSLWNHGQLLPYLQTPKVYWCPSQTGKLGAAGDIIDVSEEVNSKWLLIRDQVANSEYLYRKEWYDKYPRYRMGPLANEKFSILVDHFWSRAGRLAVESGHKSGYNILRVGGNVFYFEHPRLNTGDLDPAFNHTPGASGELEWGSFDTFRPEDGVSVVGP